MTLTQQPGSEARAQLRAEPETRPGRYRSARTLRALAVLPRLALLALPYVAVEGLAFLLHLACLPLRFSRADELMRHYAAGIRGRREALLGARPLSQLFLPWDVPAKPRDPRALVPQELSRDLPVSILGCLFGPLFVLGILSLGLGWLVTARWVGAGGDPQIFVVCAFLTLVGWLFGCIPGGGLYVFLVGTQIRQTPLDSSEIRQLHQSRREIAAAFEIERQRIERDLHDGAQQYIVASSLKIAQAAWMLQKLAPQLAQGSEKEQLEKICALLNEGKEASSEGLAALRRTVHGVHTQVLRDRGLEAAVRDAVAASVVDTTLTVPKPLPPLPPGLASAAYFFVCEALNNIAKYVPEQPRADILIVADNMLVISVLDNGTGGAQIVPGHGLSGLQARIEAFGGSLRVYSPAGSPTKLRAALPLIGPFVDGPEPP